MVDFARAKLLMDTIVAAGQHGPMYQTMAAEAGRELKKMMEQIDPSLGRQPQTVTPAAGPADHLVRDGDGELVERRPLALTGVPMSNRPQTREETEAEERHNLSTNPPQINPTAEPDAVGIVGEPERRI